MKLTQSTLSIKKELYNRIRLQISDLLGHEDREIKKSEKALARLFSETWSRATLESFRRALNSARIVFWGDFHGVRQSQRTVLRWLENLGPQQAHLALGLECFPSNAQKHLDLYLSGQISEQDLLSRVRWSRIWGFPWEHYKPLLEWAKQNKRPVIALNLPQKKANLIEREKWALRRLNEHRSHNPKDIIWVLYGEYHLLPQHFEKRLAKREKALFVLQNSDRLYFDRQKLDSSGPSQRGTAPHLEQVFKGPRNYFCLQNVPPWVKWQTYYLFLDLKEDQEIEEGLELTDHVLSWARVLSQELGLKLRESEFSIYTSDDAAFWEKLKTEIPEHQALYRNFLEEGMSFVSPSGRWAYLARISVNEAAALAMQMLYFQQAQGFDWPYKDDDFWERVIWIMAISYFGSKLVNPHRRTASLQELRKRVRSSQRPFERQAARLTVAFWLKKSLGQQDELFGKLTSDRVRILAVRWLAGLWGETLYNAHHRGLLAGENMKSFICKNPSGENFKLIFQHLLEIISEFQEGV